MTHSSEMKWCVKIDLNVSDDAQTTVRSADANRSGVYGNASTTIPPLMPGVVFTNTVRQLTPRPPRLAYVFHGHKGVENTPRFIQIHQLDKKKVAIMWSGGQTELAGSTHPTSIEAALTQKPQPVIIGPIITRCPTLFMCHLTYNLNQDDGKPPQRSAHSSGCLIALCWLLPHNTRTHTHTRREAKHRTSRKHTHTH